MNVKNKKFISNGNKRKEMYAVEAAQLELSIQNDK